MLNKPKVSSADDISNFDITYTN